MKTQRSPLTVMNAEINTAAVKINTLQISGKQVTLAVFRQLPMGHPLVTGEDPTKPQETTWKGVPWGWVNYLCPVGHRNVVWQKGEELYRGVMVPPPRSATQLAHECGWHDSAEHYEQWHTELCARWEELSALPQLFIAV